MSRKSALDSGIKLTLRMLSEGPVTSELMERSDGDKESLVRAALRLPQGMSILTPSDERVVLNGLYLLHEAGLVQQNRRIDRHDSAHYFVRWTLVAPRRRPVVPKEAGRTANTYRLAAALALGIEL